MVLSRIAGWTVGLALLIPELASAADCTALRHTAVAGASVTSAQMVDKGPLSAITAGGDEPALDLPRFCRVTGLATGSSINFEVWLPAKGWNGRFLSVGTDGFAGKQPFAALADGLNRGFPVTGNDAGRQGDNRNWMNDPSKGNFGDTAPHTW